MPYNILLFHVYYSMNPRVLITQILHSHTTFFRICHSVYISPQSILFVSGHMTVSSEPRGLSINVFLTTLLPAAPSLFKSYYRFRKGILGEPAPCSSKNRITMSPPQQMARGQCVRTPIVIDQAPLFKSYRNPDAQLKLQLQCVY